MYSQSEYSPPKRSAEKPAVSPSFREQKDREERRLEANKERDRADKEGTHQGLALSGCMQTHSDVPFLQKFNINVASRRVEG